MADANQGGDPAPLPIRTCPESQRKHLVSASFSSDPLNISFFAGQIQPSRRGCNFYRWQHGYADHLASLGPAAPQLAQIQPPEEQGGQGLGVQDIQLPHAPQGRRNGAPEGTQFISSVCAVAGYILAALPTAGRQGTAGVDAASINLVVSVANLVIGVAILVFVVADVVMRVLA
ncbi:unnamed protein product [Triticum turgidum subsp. durum]|uniref:Uncharacterized protein n=1 Tax=Triticum turgidum subsp. durum TaxID=4567 RepID=A0A9R1Q3F4_TRITD|nr:unnamed protein product [Triticum turgidum subsp. durum]